MNIGMLWFDNDPRTALTAKVVRAADYYKKKYGLVADLCLVHPSMLYEPRPVLKDEPTLRAVERSAIKGPTLSGATKRSAIKSTALSGATKRSAVEGSEVEEPVLSEVEGPTGKVAIRPNRAIMPGHLWIGMEEKC